MTEKQEPIMVEAEVIDTGLMVADQVKPLLDQVIEKLDRRTESILRAYPAATPITDRDTYRTCKKARTELRKEMKAIGDQRKEFKEPFAWAVGEIDRRYKEALEQVDGLEAGYKAELDAWEERRRLERHQMLLATFTEGYPGLAGHVDFDLLDARHQSGSESWYAASCSDEKARQMLMGDVDAIAADVQVIDTMNFPDDDDRVQLIADYYATLHLQDAIARSNERQAAKAREAERKARIKADEEARFERMRQAQMEAEQATPAESAPQTAPEPAVREIMRSTYQITVSLTEDEREALIGFMKANGIHGRIKEVTNE